MAVFLPSVDPALPNPPPDATEYQRALDQRLRELFVALNTAVEPLARYKTDAQILTADADELSGVSWATAGAGDIWRAKTVRYATVDPGAGAVSQVGVNWTLFGAFSSFAAAASTNLLTNYPRLVASTAAAANSQKQQAASGAMYWLGNAAGLGGCRYEQVWGVVATQTTMRTAVGFFTAAPAIAAAEPSAQVSCIFMGCDAGDTTMQIMHNDGAGTCTKIDLGASFPKTNNVVYLLVLEWAANGSTVTYTVTRLDSAATVTGTLSTNLPANTTFLIPAFVVGNGGTAAVASIAWMRFLTEQPQ